MLANGLRHTTTTTGTGAITLVAVSGSPGFTSVFGTTGTRRVSYSICADASGQPGDLIETGVGDLNLATLSLTRTAKSTWDGASYAITPGTAANLAAGTKWVLCSPVAEAGIWPGFYNAASEGFGNPPDNQFVNGTGAYNLVHQQLLAIYVKLRHHRPIGRITMRFPNGYTGGTSSVEAAIAEINSAGKPSIRLTGVANFGSLAGGNLGGTFTPVWLPPGDYAVLMRAAFTGGTGTPTLLHGNVVPPSPWGSRFNFGNSRQVSILQIGGQTSIPADVSALGWGTADTGHPYIFFGD